MYVISDNTIKISVRNLVEFLLRSGDIDNRDSGVSDVKLMQEGARIHRKIQKSKGSSYHAEVALKMDFPIDMSDKKDSFCGNDISYIIRIEGRADGIICDMNETADGDKVPVSNVTIDEIKTMQADISKMEEPVYVHKAQAMCYAYIYASQNSLDGISVQLTYCNIDNEDIKLFKQDYSYEELSEWFNDLLEKFIKWTDFVFEERFKRQQSIEGLGFPFEYRKGQKNLVVGVYKTIQKEKNLYIQAPTGVGKTISTIYPAVMAVGQNYADKIFYLTSKTITRTVASNTFAILRDEGLSFRTVIITAKDKICPLDERDCNPVKCQYAKGHFDRINDAVFDMVTTEEDIDRDTITSYSQKHNVCPFELSLDASYWCDGIICDYNYVFDPNATLKRYFADGNPKGDYIFLVDEAHNLVDRAREMYSATLVKEDFLKVKKIVKDTDKRLYNSLEKCNKYMLQLKRTCDTYRIIDSLGQFPVDLERCFSNMHKFIDKHKKHPDIDSVLEFYFKIRHFLNMYDCLDEKYVIYAQHDSNGDFIIKLLCVDPSGNISLRLAQARSTIFFSATFLPINYFKEMLSGNTKDNAVYAQSPFDTKNKIVAVGTDVSSRYRRRNRSEYRKICDYIFKTVSAKKGNYMVFFPSYGYMDAVYKEFEQMYDCEQMNIVMQSTGMKENDKEKFLELFDTSNQEKDSNPVIGFCVTGGVFSEGIDLKNDSLIGAIIVGTGLPMVCLERNILKEYFNDCGKDGYAYAYTYPGMNKVLQASGRVIRTVDDKGIIVLLDDRFLTDEYEKLFPREWDVVYPVTQDNISTVADDFWKNLVQ